MNNKIAMFPGSFDPPTFGHLDIIKRASSLYDKVYVVVADNINKKSMFTSKQRMEMLCEITKELNNVEVRIYDGLIVNFAKENNIGVIIRGVRALTDFNYEFEIAQTNKFLCPEIEIVFLPCKQEFITLRSSSIKELVQFGADVTSMVPPCVSRAIRELSNS